MSAHVIVEKWDAHIWHSCCQEPACAEHVFHCTNFDTHAEALAAALDHCRRYPQQPATRTEPAS